MSIMRRPVESDWPYINLNEQKRMCPGQFDLPNEVTYGHVNMAPGMSAADDRFAIARACDGWLVFLGAIRIS